jgi:hypothetical protein
MKTEVIMKREIFGKEVSQKSKTGFFSATDLVKAGNKFRSDNGLGIFNLSLWLKSKSTTEFISELDSMYGKSLIKGRGRSSHTWVHPYLFIDLALSINPKLKITVYKWLYDCLLQYRNSSGDSYKKMTGALFIAYNNKTEFMKNIKPIADRIKNECGVAGWETATEKQLKLRDKIHEYVSLFVDIIKDIDQAIDLAIDRAIKETNQ